MEFLNEESCGKCTPCREGLFQLYNLAVKISEGMAREEDLDKMERLSTVIIRSSLCGLGKSGPNPFLSSLKYFRDEYLAHIRDHKCPAGVCRALIRYEIQPDLCDGCTACMAVCGAQAITGSKGEVHVIDQEKCDRCGACYAICNRNAIKVL
jgi:NAD-dependent dihydropyrimidine dehydrogenase PreA subunit